MSVLVVAYSVIVPVPVLEEAYPGGPSQYQRDCPNQSFSTDGHLTCVAFMSPPEVTTFVERLQRFGLVHLENGRAVDMVVVDQDGGPLSPCDWIDGGHHPDGYSAVWRAGSAPGPVAHPKGWDLEWTSKLHRIPDEEMDERLLRLNCEREGEPAAYLDYKTGKILYSDRVWSPDDTHDG